ncbi:MAG: hypothetical protein HYU63_05880 [Armatimonadetes bacterium]|nr:hypothetical protein [Armatimonadota bacterium]
MQKKQINSAVILCKNGLGHTARTGLILNEWLKRDNKISLTVICSKEQELFLKKWNNSSFLRKNTRVKWKEFDTLIDFKFFAGKVLSVGEIIEKFKNLKLENYDLVISDNLVEPLFYNKNTVIIGSFLWHDIYRDYKSWKDYHKKCEDIIYSIKPNFIVNKYFFMPVFKNYKNIHKVGFLPFIKRINGKRGNNILLQAGNTSQSDDFIKDFVKQISKYNNNNKINLLLDKRFKFKDKSNFIRYVDFEKMRIRFKDIFLTILRPGMGSITNNVNSLTPMLLFKLNDSEIKHNLKKCLELGIGKRFNFFTLKKILQRGNESEDLSPMRKNMEKLDINGLDESLVAIKKVLKVFNLRG